MSSSEQDKSSVVAPETVLEEDDAQIQPDGKTGIPKDNPDSISDDAPDENRGFAADLFEWSHALMSAVVIIVLLFAFCFSMFSVRQTSMTNTLQPGDMLLISDLFYTPKPGDIVMFTHAGVPSTYDAENDRYSPLVKRVIAVAGDTIYYDESLKKLVVNGQVLEEPYLRDQDFRARGFLLDEEVTVPEGYIFACGDNRNDSLDSREIGFVDERMVLGRVLLRLFPMDRFGTV